MAAAAAAAIARFGGNRPGGKRPPWTGGEDWKRGKPRLIPKLRNAARRLREFIVDRRRNLPVVPPRTNKKISFNNIFSFVSL